MPLLISVCECHKLCSFSDGLIGHLDECGNSTMHVYRTRKLLSVDGFKLMTFEDVLCSHCLRSIGDDMDQFDSHVCVAIMSSCIQCAITK